MVAVAVKDRLKRHPTMEGMFRRAEINQIDHIEVVYPLTVRVGLKSFRTIHCAAERSYRYYLGARRSEGRQGLWPARGRRD